MTKVKERRSKKVKKYVSIEDVKCPVCNGVINSKWFNFRTGNTVEFVAECWSGDINDQYNDEPKPRHIFYFQIKTPLCVLFDKKGKQYLDEEDEDD